MAIKEPNLVIILDLERTNANNNHRDLTRIWSISRLTVVLVEMLMDKSLIFRDKLLNKS